METQTAETDSVISLGVDDTGQAIEESSVTLVEFYAE
jgi:hypothetical protein